jgi:hypothetical protein
MTTRTPRRPYRPSSTTTTGTPANFFACLGDADLDRAIGKLERLVRSLEREANGAHIARGYRGALEQAQAERRRRHVTAATIATFDGPAAER